MMAESSVRAIEASRWASSNSCLRSATSLDRTKHARQDEMIRNAAAKPPVLLPTIILHIFGLYTVDGSFLDFFCASKVSLRALSYISALGVTCNLLISFFTFASFIVSSRYSVVNEVFPKHIDTDSMPYLLKHAAA